MNNRNISRALFVIALSFSTGLTAVMAIIEPIKLNGDPTWYGEAFGCCIVIWAFLFIVGVYNKINKH